SNLEEKLAELAESDQEDEEVEKGPLRAVYGPRKSGSASRGASSPTQSSSSSEPSSAFSLPKFINDIIDPNNKSTSPASNPSISNTQGIPESADSKEQEPIRGYVGFFGDSNLEAFAEPKKFLNLADGGKGYAIRGYNTRQVMAQLGIDKHGNSLNGQDKIPDIGKMEKVVINCGLNDVASNIPVSEITHNLKVIVNYFQKKGKKVYLSTLTPFGGPNYQYFKTNQAASEEKRLEINKYILTELQGQPNLRIIPLHLTKAQGGVASGQKDGYGNDTLDSIYNSGDQVHMKAQEFSKLLSKYLKEENTNPNSFTADSSNNSPQATASNVPTKSAPGKEDFWRKNAFGAPKGFTSGGISQEAATRSMEVLRTGNLKPGEHLEETIDGVTYAFIHEGHPKSSSDLESPWHPAVSVYVKKDSKKAKPPGKTT
ncbi:MAG: SGNH/GDSL hydrolase family protein, partial [Candidatus Altimarinota bacterium]